MSVRVAINGFGRIGRLTFRNLINRGGDFDVVAINDLTDNSMLATLLKYDSTHRRFNGSVDCDEQNLIVNGEKIRVFEERNPTKLPWKELGVDVVIESTGVFTHRKTPEKPGYDSHLDAGAKRVILSAPAKDAPDLTVVMGVNDDKLTTEMRCVSNASCTTNCLAPVAKVLHDTFGIERGLMTTVHAYTNDQRVQDMPHSDPYRARSAAQNIIPTSTGAAKAVGLVIPDLQRDFGIHRGPDRFDGHHRRFAQLDFCRTLDDRFGRSDGESGQLVRQRMGLQLPHRGSGRQVRPALSQSAAAGPKRSGPGQQIGTTPA